jgi:hypothetical protein
MEGLEQLVFHPTSVWLWTKISEGFIKSITEKLGGKAAEKALEKWKEVKWDKIERNYKERVKEIYGWTRVLGKPDKITLDGIFTDVFVIDKPRALQYYDISKLTKEIHIKHEDEKRINGLELVKQKESNRLFVLGKPGAGKTTFLRYITYQATEGFLPQTPIFISLNDWSNSKLNLMNYINLQFDICGFPDKDGLPFIEYLLEQGEVIVLFDGLDEVNIEGGLRRETISSIRDFCRKYYKTQCLITCRNATTGYTFEDFKYVELADFTEKQVENYINKWFSDQLQKRERLKDELALPENQRIRELANTPILLSLICLTFDSIQTFPSRKVEIYEEALEILLKKWDAEREIKRDEIYKDLSPKRKLQMLSRIAARTFEKNQYFIKQETLSEYIVEYLKALPNADEFEIDGDVVLKAIESQHGIFTERAKKIYSFSHLTFQEYFTSKYIIENQNKGTLETLLTLENILNPKWREVILNTVSLLDDASPFFEIFRLRIEEIIEGDSDIDELLTWANEKALGVKSEVKQFKVREFYYTLALQFRTLKDSIHEELSRMFSRFQADFSHKTYSQAIVPLKLNVENKSYKSLVISNFKTAFTDLEPLIKFSKPATREFEMWLDLHLWINWVFAEEIILFKEGLEYIEFNEIFQNEFRDFKESLLFIKEELIKNNQVDLYPALKEVAGDSEFSRKDELKSIRNELLQVIREQRGIKTHWNFQLKQREKLHRYNKAIELLAKCLELATVDNRKEIEDILYAPLS